MKECCCKPQYSYGFDKNPEVTEHDRFKHQQPLQYREQRESYRRWSHGEGSSSMVSSWVSWHRSFKVPEFDLSLNWERVTYQLPAWKLTAGTKKSPNGKGKSSEPSISIIVFQPLIFTAADPRLVLCDLGSFEEARKAYRQSLGRLPMYYFSHVVHFNLESWIWRFHGKTCCKFTASYL